MAEITGCFLASTPADRQRRAGTQMDKDNALRQAALDRRTADDDVDTPWALTSPSRSIPLSP
jgi:hypothetical protein